jgi:hypothetical protein
MKTWGNSVIHMLLVGAVSKNLVTFKHHLPCDLVNPALEIEPKQNAT